MLQQYYLIDKKCFCRTLKSKKKLYLSLIDFACESFLANKANSLPDFVLFCLFPCQGRKKLTQ